LGGTGEELGEPFGRVRVRVRDAVENPIRHAVFSFIEKSNDFALGHF
jgi:hypothetical protein